MQDEQYNELEVKKAKELKNNIKAGFYTLIIFAIVLFIWVYTNPFFNQRSNNGSGTNSPVLSSETVQTVDSISTSFKTMWSDVSAGISSLKKK